MFESIDTKPPFECDHSKLRSCASQANDDYGPGRSGLVGELTPEMVEKIRDSDRIDVPAIQETVKVSDLSPELCAAATEMDLVRSMQSCARLVLHYTCEDKSRFLLESVDGTDHICHRKQP